MNSSSWRIKKVRRVSPHFYFLLGFCFFFLTLFFATGLLFSSPKSNCSPVYPSASSRSARKAEASSSVNGFFAISFLLTLSSIHVPFAALSGCQIRNHQSEIIDHKFLFLGSACTIPFIIPFPFPRRNDAQKGNPYHRRSRRDRPGFAL